MQFLFDRINEEARLRPNEIVLSDDHCHLSWSDLKHALAHGARLQKALGSRLGLLCSNSCDYVVAQLSAVFSGITLVPLPDFFSDEQLATIVQDAALDAICIDAAHEARAARLEKPLHRLVIQTEPCEALAFTPGFGMIIYTSGSSGTPKGVCHGEKQLEAVVRALALASKGRPDDRYLSVLPLPMLLETICAIFLPILCGARIRLATDIARQVMRGQTSGILSAILAEHASAIVLVPQLLRTLVFQLKVSGMRAPASLRFVAVGGAAVPADSLVMAEELGLPVYEGYGLSECCSVVTLNTDEAKRPGTAGKPLDGIRLHIEDGEILVESPSVMTQYLNGPRMDGIWRTGDLGSIDADGFLTVHGRKDNLIVTSLGRNISPEWVENALACDPRIALAVVTGPAEPALRALLIPSAFGRDWFAAAGEDEIRALVMTLCRTLPAYAVPQDIRRISMEQAAQAMLFTANGRPVRSRIRAYLSRPQDALLAETLSVSS
ncbi:AMP-binding protein [Allorhizobium sp. BGMRC 0089]|uniref:AMP-binding protein n=1 Tax=Allorhizobium sonneratiae TaxID=2934936 RepID=UPI0020349E5A|nr:AMP-binding protein [Allorhizobium sonneratiae]MCM2293793.1 AMP-binding protein [Allorhizobium sonneratiae]